MKFDKFVVDAKKEEWCSPLTNEESFMVFLRDLKAQGYCHRS
jgi:hypothetical protein